MITIPLLESIKKYIINPFIGLLFVWALLVFLWGMVEYLRGAASPTERESGARHMIYGVIGLVIMASVFGIMNIICITIQCN